MLKRALIVFAHPSPKSYCGALKDVTLRKLDSLGYETSQSDLYQMKFDPVFDMKDLQFKKIKVDDAGDVVDEETAKLISTSVLRNELDKVLAANYLFFIAPTWMGSFPAILKGWIDRVLTAGFVGKLSDNIYKNGYLRGKKCMIITSTGFDKDHYSRSGNNSSGQTIEDNYKHIINEVFAYNGMETFPVFAIYGMDNITSEQRSLYLEKLSKTMEDIEKLKPIMCPLLHDP